MLGGGLGGDSAGQDFAEEDSGFEFGAGIVEEPAQARGAHEEVFECGGRVLDEALDVIQGGGRVVILESEVNLELEGCETERVTSLELGVIADLAAEVSDESGAAWDLQEGPGEFEGFFEVAVAKEQSGEAICGDGVRRGLRVHGTSEADRFLEGIRAARAGRQTQEDAEPFIGGVGADQERGEGEQQGGIVGCLGAAEPAPGGELGGGGGVVSETASEGIKGFLVPAGAEREGDTGALQVCSGRARVFEMAENAEHGRGDVGGEGPGEESAGVFEELGAASDADGGDEQGLEGGVVEVIAEETVGACGGFKGLVPAFDAAIERGEEGAAEMGLGRHGGSFSLLEQRDDQPWGLDGALGLEDPFEGGQAFVEATESSLGFRMQEDEGRVIWEEGLAFEAEVHAGPGFAGLVPEGGERAQFRQEEPAFLIEGPGGGEGAFEEAADFAQKTLQPRFACQPVAAELAGEPGERVEAVPGFLGFSGGEAVLGFTGTAEEPAADVTFESRSGHFVGGFAESLVKEHNCGGGPFGVLQLRCSSPHAAEVAAQERAKTLQTLEHGVALSPFPGLAMPPPPPGASGRFRLPKPRGQVPPQVPHQGDGGRNLPFGPCPDPRRRSSADQGESDSLELTGLRGGWDLGLDEVFGLWGSVGAA